MWLSEYGAKRWSDYRIDGAVPMHAHSIDAAQEGFYKACTVTRALKKANIATARFPHRLKKFRTTVWKKIAMTMKGDRLILSTGRSNEKIWIRLPVELQNILQILEVRLVYDRRARRYNWHVVVENGRQPKQPLSGNVVAVDLGEIHPAVVGDEQHASIVTCRERRSLSQGHAKRTAKLQAAMSRCKKGSRRWKRLRRTKIRMVAKYKCCIRDVEHKISMAIVDVAVERQAATIVIGDVRDIADKGEKGKVQNQRMSRWDHGTIRRYVTYKAAAEGIVVELVDEAYTTQTCPQCGNRHKPRGRRYRCPSCGFQAHRDVVGCVNILSRHVHGEVGKIPAPQQIKYRIPHNLRVMRRCGDTRQTGTPVARDSFREAVGL